MFSRRLLLAIVASPMFFPVSWAVGTIPAAHVFSLASTRDLAAGEAAHGAPVGIPLVERALPGAAVVFPVGRVPEALSTWPGLTPRLPPTGNTAHGDDDRVAWRVLGDDADAQLVEVRLETKRATRIVRYRATDAGVALLTSRMFTRMHAFAGLAVGALFATLVFVVARRARARLPALPPPRRPRA